MLTRLLFLALLVLVAGAEPAAGIVAPPPPKTYDVTIHYRILAFRTERVRQYFEMLRHFQQAGFQLSPDEPEEADNPEATRLHGTIPASRANRLLSVLHVHNILLVPQGTPLPADKTQPVRVDIQLVGPVDPPTQHRLHEQTFEVLASLGFRGAVGYDHHGYTRLLGSIPADQVEKLLDDLRALPAGAKQGAPFARTEVIRRIEARPDLPAPAPRPAAPTIPKGQEKLSPDLRALLAQEGQGEKANRLEVILAATPGEDDTSWRNPLVEAAPGLEIEGRLGPLLTIVAKPSQAPALAALPLAAAVRLPRAAAPVRTIRGTQELSWRPVQASGLERLHALGYRGKGTHLALIGNDFRGWQEQVGKKLPSTTRLIDLTREHNPDLLPDPYPREGTAPGVDLRHALAVVEAAPAVQLTLIRIDPSCPYMLEQIAQAIQGDRYRSISLDNRVAQMDLEKALLDQRREALLEERRVVFDTFETEGEAGKAKQDYLKKQADFDRDLQAHAARVQRYLAHQLQLQSLRTVRVVACVFTWTDGYPVDGSSTLSRYFDDRPFRGALWFQAAGDTAGQTWSGLFRDEDGNGVMEFAPFDRFLPPDLWAPELNFLWWRDAAGKGTSDLPAGARLRIAVQWQEVHNPLYLRTGEDAYREPLARIRLVLVSQPDPEGKKEPADDLQVVAQSVGLPERLTMSANMAVYEQTLEVSVPRAGRYAIRIEGRTPEGIDPPGAPTLPATQKWSELRLRLHVTTLAGPGRAVWHDFATEVGSVGMPADAQGVIVVGAADGQDRPQPYSAGGAPFNQELHDHSTVFAYDEGEGTGQAACFAAGLLAAVSSAQPKKPPFAPVPWSISTRPVLRIPDDWSSRR